MEGFFQTNFEYTSFGKIQEYQGWVYDNAAHIWIQQRKYVVNYGSNNLPIEAFEYSNNNAQAIAKYNCAYNTNDLLLSEVKHIWQNGHWINNSRKFEFSYNSSALPISKLRYESGGLVSIDEFHYNSIDSLIAIDHKSYMGEILSKTIIERDIDNDVTSILSLGWKMLLQTLTKATAGDTMPIIMEPTVFL